MNTNHLQDVYGAIARIKNAREARLFLEDILTPRELNSVSERFQIFKLLAAGTTQRRISSFLNASISKVVRGAAAWRRSQGGIKTVLQRLGYMGLRDPME